MLIKVSQASTYAKLLVYAELIGTQGTPQRKHEP
jgi:hypothetical protein